MRNVISDFLFGFSALFAIINPYGVSFIFLRRTAYLTNQQRQALAAKVAVYAFGVLVVSLFAGSTILGFFGISIAALRISGGLVVAAAAWAMLNEPPEAPNRGAQEDGSTATMAFFPLTVPLTAGPGTIATAIALGANRSSDFESVLTTYATLLAIAAAVSLPIYHAYRSSAMFSRYLGGEGTRVVTNLSAFLLLCVGVQITITGIADAANTMLVLPQRN